ncbi:MAG: tyrosine--tRNA ligase [Candidatus Pacebacteria bacterium]|nr:tyrosine--tRNA ligase [Candidatus Paceibacterota bacterium]
MKINSDEKKIEEILTKGVEEVIEKDSLIKKLKSGKKLRIKHGIDPTGPRIHLGRALQFRKLKAFQDLGHQIVLIIGDFTALIGDASDKTSMRRSLSENEIKENMKDYKRQIGKILDIKKTEFCYNSKWLKKLNSKDLISLSMNFTAQQMITRRNFKERWASSKPIGLHELLYPLFQGYDSVAVSADVEIGGTDQLFNLKVGRQLQETSNMPVQDIMTLKMLPGLDSRKMSTSWGNIITIMDKPQEMFGRIMSMTDNLIPDYFELATDASLKEIQQIKKELKGKANPKDLKLWLAKEIVRIYHGEKLASESEKEFERVFKNKKAPTDIDEVKIEGERIPIIDLLVKLRLVSSKSEAKRLIVQRAVRIDNEVQADLEKIIEIKKGMIIKAGKRRFAKIV